MGGTAGQRNHCKGIHGDAMTQRKDDDMARILFQNVGGLGFVSGDVAQESMKNMIINKSIDIVGLTEVNKD